MDETDEKRKHLTCDEVLQIERDIQADLKQTVKHLELENSILKSEYDMMKLKLKGCDTILERNITIFQDIVDVNRSALHTTRGLDYSVVSISKPNKSSEKRVVPVLRENNNLQYVKQKAAERKLLETSGNSINLTIIPEENSQAHLSDVYVQLTPLPKPVIDRFLRKITLGNIENESVSSPQFTSTPTIYQLGLSSKGEAAAGGVDSRFVNKRTKRRKTDSDEELEAGGRLSLQISVQAARPPRHDSGDKVTIRRKRIKVEPDEHSSTSGSESGTYNEIIGNSSEISGGNNGRPVRQLRKKAIKSFKEPSLTTKMRRS